VHVYITITVIISSPSCFLLKNEDFHFLRVVPARHFKFDFSFSGCCFISLVTLQACQLRVSILLLEEYKKTAKLLGQI
jgi:hypothetical protein